MILAASRWRRSLPVPGSASRPPWSCGWCSCLCHLGVEPQRLTVIPLSPTPPVRSCANNCCGCSRTGSTRSTRPRRGGAMPHFPFGARQPGPRGARQSRAGSNNWTTATPPPSRTTPAAGRLRPFQQRLLKQATYQQCYAESPAFRAKTHKLLELPPLAEPEEGARDGSRRRRWSRSSWPASSRRCRCTEAFPCPGRVRREPGPARRTPGRRQAGMRVAREIIRRSHGTVLGEVPGAVARGRA